MRSQLQWSLVWFAVCGSAGGCKKKATPATTEGSAAAANANANANAGSGDTATATPPASGQGTAPATAPAVAPASGCTPPEKIEGDYKITEKCVVKLAGSLEVGEAGTLEIAAGSKLAFPKGSKLTVDGKLVASGTADAPITFTSADDTPNPGDWGGIVFDDKTHAGNVLDHVIVTYAGENDGYGEAAIHLYNDVGPDRVAITNSEVSHAKGAGILIDKPASKTKLENNTFKDDSKASIVAPAEVWSTIGVNTCGDQPPHVAGGDVTKTGSWPKLDAPYIIDDSVVIGGPDAPILTLPEGATLKFAKDKLFRIGEGEGGGLVAKKVTFTSAEVTPDEGDWGGLVFLEKATGTNLDGCSIQYAGGGTGYGKGPIMFYNAPVAKVGKRVAITNLALSNDNKLGIMAPDGDCGLYADGSAGNKSDGAPLCQPK